MMKFLIAVLFASFLLSCSSSTEETVIKKTNKVLNSLKENQAKISLIIDGLEFYEDSSIFQGGGYVDEKGIKLSLKDQSKGNVIVSIEGNNWSKSKPYRIEFKNGYPTSSTMGSFLVGKISNSSENRGIGYVLYDGYFEVKYISKDLFLVIVKGNLKKPFGDDLLSKIEGSVIWKKPNYSIESGKGIEIEIPK